MHRLCDHSFIYTLLSHTYIDITRWCIKQGNIRLVLKTKTGVRYFLTRESAFPNCLKNRLQDITVNNLFNHRLKLIHKRLLFYVYLVRERANVRFLPFEKKKQIY